MAPTPQLTPANPPVAPPAGAPSIPTSTLPSGSSSNPSLVARTQKWIEDNKLIVLGAAVLAAGGMGYYLYSSHPSNAKRGGSGKTNQATESSSDDDANRTAGTGGAGASSDKKKKKKKSKSKKTTKDADGPILEERDPAEVQRMKNKTAAGEETVGTNEDGSPSYMEGVPSTPEKLAAMSAEERKTLATTLKNRGNKLYAGKHYEEAASCYTKALEIAVKEEAVYYSNRAACWQNLSPPQYEKVLKDCDAALKLDPLYVKALNRRATAFENLSRDEEALRDFTATTIMERFQNTSAAESVERVLKKIASKKAEEIMKAREPKLPSTTFVSSYLGAFRPRELDSDLLMRFDSG